MTRGEQYRAILDALEALWMSGEGENAKADELREQADSVWRSMTRAEKDDYMLEHRT